MEEGSSGDLIGVVFKGEVAVKNDSEVTDVWRGRQSGVIHGEAGLGLAVEKETMSTYDVAKGEHVEDEQERTKH